MEKRILLLAAVAVLVIGIGAVNAQSERSPVSIDQVNSPGIEHNDAVKNFVFDFLLAADFSQLVNDPSTQGNKGTINQYGERNKAALQQRGMGNTSYIQIGSSGNPVFGNEAYVEQRGQGQISVVSMQGNENYLSFLQEGQNQGALFYFQGDNIRFDAQQLGSGIQLRPAGSSMPMINISSNRQTVPVIIGN